MASFIWVKEGIDVVDATTTLTAALAITDTRAALVTDDPLTFDWDWTSTDLTFQTGTGLDEKDVHAAWTGPWHDPVNQCVYHKNPAITFTNGTVAPVTVTGLAYYNSDSGILYGVMVFDDAIVLNVGDAVEIDLFAGIGTCNPAGIVTVMEA